MFIGLISEYDYLIRQNRTFQRNIAGILEIAVSVLLKLFTPEDQTNITTQRLSTWRHFTASTQALITSCSKLN